MNISRVFSAISFAMISIGRSLGMITDYTEAKQAALRIIELNQRQSQIHWHDESGIILVGICVGRIII